MKNLIVFISIVAINSAIRVPNAWNDLYPTTVTVKTYKEVRPRKGGTVPHQHGHASTQRFISSVQPEVTGSGWSPALPTRSNKVNYYKTKPKYYKKPIQPIQKTKKPFSKTRIIKSPLENPKRIVPYITYKKPDNSPEFIPPRPLTIYPGVYPHIKQTPKNVQSLKHQQTFQNNQSPIKPNPSSVYSTFDESFNFAPERPRFPSKELNTYEQNIHVKSKPDLNFVASVEQSDFRPSNPSAYQPNKNIINYFEAVKNDIPAVYTYPTIAHTKEKLPEKQNTYEVHHKQQNNQVEHYTPKENDLGYYTHLYKDYRDDKTFEPENKDPHYVTEEDPKFEREEAPKSPSSSHEIPNEIPTRPIYPGEGLWATPGLKHTPFISKQTYDQLKEEEVKPKGYDTFIEGKKLFNLTADNLTQRFRSFPDSNQIGTFIHQEPITASKSESKEESSEVTEENNNEEDEFVPTRLYAQVRASEDTEYLPLEDADDGKLREAIKESKIHTVYTEEGYEDSAYDHAGHEKEAANDEGFEDLQREKLEKKEKKVPDAKANLHLPNFQRTKFSHGGELLSDEEIEKIKQEQLGLIDSDAAGTQYKDFPLDNIEDSKTNDNDDYKTNDEHETNEDDEEEEFTTEHPKKPKVNNKNFISTKETKTMTTKEKDDGDTETEISSKVKIILQPNNSTKSQKYIKIYPKVYKTIRRKKPQTDDEIDENTKEKPKKLEETSSGKENESINFSEIFIEELIPTTEIPFTKFPSTEYPEESEEIPITTLPTTAIPKPIKSKKLPKNKAEEALEGITKEFLKNSKRTKRYANDFSNLKIESDFVPKINHEFGKVSDYKKIKYPYYHDYKNNELNINSPLRYSQDMKQIPNKTGKRMVFYEEAEKRAPCPEINTNLNPIPEKVLNAEKNKLEENSNKNTENEDEDNVEDEDEKEENNDEEKENTDTRKKRDVDEQSKSPRLAGLGDKIDCLKSRYFGAEPLDSPFFDEVTVGTIEPIFKELKITTYKKGKEESDNNIEVNKKIKVKKQTDLKNNYEDSFDEEKLGKSIFKDIENQLEKRNKNVNTPATQSKVSFEDNDKNMLQYIKNNSIKTTPTSTTPTISLLTTPEYTIDLKPKHIYDQIELLEYLPTFEEVFNNKSSTNDVQRELSFSSRQYKLLDDDNLAYESSDDNPMLPEAEELRRRRKIRRKRPPFQIFDINKFLPTTPKTIFQQPATPFPHVSIDTSNAIPKATNLKIFDVNKFLPTTPPTYREIVTSSTVLPKYKVLSEVFYKDDIKPNEQLHVFTDILNNIKNSSQQQEQEQNLQYRDTFIESSEPVSVILNSKKDFDNLKQHTPVHYQDSYLQAYGDQEIDQNYLAPIVTTTSTTTTTTMRPTTYRGRIRNKVKKSPENTVPPKHVIDNNDFQQKLKLYIALQEAAKQKLQYNPVKAHTEYGHVNANTDYGYTIPVSEDNSDYVDKTTKVMGLLPPGTNRYKTIYHPKRDNSLQISNPNQINRRVNKFLVVGMKPPPHQKILVYSDFLNKNHLTKKTNLRRGKRSAGRGSYAPLSRNRGQQESELEKAATTDNDDDYVPHRPKNYYYDEKTGSIIYLTTKTPEEDADEVVEYEEIIEEPPVTKKPKQDNIFATATPPPEGKGYMDFVLKLKQNPNYKYIPDPTTTEKGLEPVTETSISTTLKPQLTTPPEFLNILAKVRQNNQYKLIEDKKEKKTTTEAPEELVDDEEELEDDEPPSGNIRNSPGGQIHDTNEYFGIFDVTDFIPKIKNYLPKTSYDTSKYKTIERPTSKPSTVEEDENESVEVRRRPHPTERHSTTTTEKSFLIITEEINSNADALNEATVTKQTEELPVTVKRRRSTTTPRTTSSTSSAELSTTRPTFLRRRRPTTLRSTRTTTHHVTTTRPPPSSTVSVSHEEKIRRVFRRRPSTIKTPKVEFLNEEHDGTIKILRRRSGTTQQTTTEFPTPRKSNAFVETFKKFHRSKKHGGGYKRDDTQSDQARVAKKIEQPVEVSDIPVHKDVEIIGEFDKTKRHGGNYRSEEEIEESNEEERGDQYQEKDENIEDVTEASDEKSLRISLLPHHEDAEETEEHSASNDDDDDDNDDEQKLSLEKKNKVPVVGNKKKSDKSPKGKFVTEATLLRLTDVVPKPEAFYTDPTLPRSVNMLASVNKPTSGEIFDILSSTDSSEISVNRHKKSKNVYVLDEITNKPLFIKDPSKRLYFYAPI